MDNVIKRKVIPKKTTVREELEYWNAIYVMRRLNIFYRSRVRGKLKDLQGLEAQDFTMTVLEKVISEDVSWQRSSQPCFMDFVYNVARGEISHFNRSAKERKFISYDLLQDKGKENKIPDHYNGF